LKKIDIDLHKYPAAIRFKFLEEIGIKQRTIKIPDPGLNIVEHFYDRNRETLRKRTEMLAKIYGSEGNVVTKASASYELTDNKRLYSSLKYHNSSYLIGKCLEAKETKTKGVYNLLWGLIPNKLEFDSGSIRRIDNKSHIYIAGSYTFATDKKATKDDNIKVEFETFNLIFDEAMQTYTISAWSPRLLEISNAAVDTVDEVIERATNDRVYQSKVLTADGNIVYNMNSKYSGIDDDTIFLDDSAFDCFYEMPYNPEKSSNEQLADDIRLIVAHYSTWWATDGKGIKFTHDQILENAIKTVTEIKKRILNGDMNYTFKLNNMHDIWKGLYIKIRYKLPEYLKKIGEEI